MTSTLANYAIEAAVELNMTSALANYATEAVLLFYLFLHKQLCTKRVRRFWLRAGRHFGLEPILENVSSILFRAVAMNWDYPNEGPPRYHSPPLSTEYERPPPYYYPGPG
uniref:Uncharacterized protein n=1 Tax=Timema shepardi TaxID=629360 RepID=A0A7R9AX62_TIMSH|nr:unnamed protein product [Timema shepardi]